MAQISREFRVDATGALPTDGHVLLQTVDAGTSGGLVAIGQKCEARLIGDAVGPDAFGPDAFDPDAVVPDVVEKHIGVG